MQDCAATNSSRRRIDRNPRAFRRAEPRPSRRPSAGDRFGRASAVAAPPSHCRSRPDVCHRRIRRSTPMPRTSRPDLSTPTAPSARSSARPSPPARSAAPAPAGSSWCTSTPPPGCTSISGWRWKACCAPGRCRRGRPTTPPISGSRCTSRITRSSTATSRESFPAGNYGAGAVIVWDRGEWVPVGDPLEGLEKGKLLFELKGYKLHGLWTLVKLKKGEKEWLLIKERDGWARPTRRAAGRVGAVRAHGGGSRGGTRPRRGHPARARAARGAAPAGRAEDRRS